MIDNHYLWLATSVIGQLEREDYHRLDASGFFDGFAAQQAMHRAATADVDRYAFILLRQPRLKLYKRILNWLLRRNRALIPAATPLDAYLHYNLHMGMRVAVNHQKTAVRTVLSEHLLEGLQGNAFGDLSLGLKLQVAMDLLARGCTNV